jgi:hypothetical protein
MLTKLLKYIKQGFVWLYTDWKKYDDARTKKFEERKRINRELAKNDDWKVF